MNDTNVIENRVIRPIVAQVDKADIDTLLASLATLDDGYYLTVADGESLYVAPAPEILVPASMMRGPAKIGEWHVFADFYNMNGHRLTLAERSDGWFTEQCEIRDPGPNRHTLNAVSLLGNDYLMVGRGDWVATGETVIDGERAIEFVNDGEWLSRQAEQRRQEKRDFLAANPIIEQLKPAWATEVGVEQGEELGETLIDYCYSSDLDGVFLTQEAHLKGGKLTFDEVEFRDSFRTIPTDKYETYAKQLRGFADALDTVRAEARS